MPIRYDITLSTTETNNVGLIKVRQADDESQALDVTVIENGVIKTFNGLTPFFCLMAREITGQGVSEEPVTVYDGTKGTLKYTLSANAMQMVGRNEAYFSFRKELTNGAWTEQFSTRSFYYTVEKSIYTQPFKDSNYWFTFKELYQQFLNYQKNGKISWEEFVEQNKEIIENIDPGGKVLTELIAARGGAQTLGERLDEDFEKKTSTLQVYQLQSQSTRFFAHRGASNIAPENTIPAFEFAGELGFSGIETDAWRTSDGVWVCIHDETVNRTTNGTGTVEALTSTYINTLVIDGGLNVALYDGLKVPTLEQYFRVCKKYNCVAAVEVKGTGASAYLHEIIDMAKSLGVYNQLQLIIGDQATATALRTIDKNVIIHQLSGTSQASIDFVKGLGNAIAGLVYTAVNQEVVASYHAEGIPVSTYGMSTLSQVLDLLNKNVDFIIADNHGGNVR